MLPLVRSGCASPAPPAAMSIAHRGEPLKAGFPVKINHHNFAALTCSQAPVTIVILHPPSEELIGVGCGLVWPIAEGGNFGVRNDGEDPKALCCQRLDRTFFHRRTAVATPTNPYPLPALKKRTAPVRDFGDIPCAVSIELSSLAPFTDGAFLLPRLAATALCLRVGACQDRSRDSRPHTRALATLFAFTRPLWNWGFATGVLEDLQQL